MAVVHLIGFSYIFLTVNCYFFSPWLQYTGSTCTVSTYTGVFKVWREDKSTDQFPKMHIPFKKINEH